MKKLEKESSPASELKAVRRINKEIQMNVGSLEIHTMSATTTVEVKYRITYSDLKDAMLAYDRSKPSKFRSCLGVVFILSGLFGIFTFGSEDLIYGILFLAIGIIFLVRGLVYIVSFLAIGGIEKCMKLNGM